MRAFWLGAQMLNLEEAGYVAIGRKFVQALLPSHGLFEMVVT